MNLSVTQWIALVLLDFAIRAGITGLGPIFIGHFVAPAALSLLHLAVFAVVNYSVEPLQLHHRTRLATILIVTNVVFAACFILYTVDIVGRGPFRNCFSPPPPFCEWIEGRITWYGARALAALTAVLVAINLFCVLIALAFGRSARSAGETEPRAAEATPDMLLSAGQWIGLALNDFVVRAAYMTVLGFFLPLIWLAVGLSFLHLVIFGLVGFAAAALPLRRGLVIAVALIAANLIFVTAFVAYRVDSEARFRSTICYRGQPAGCTWFDGRMTSEGATRLAEDASALVAINLVCVLFALPLGRSRPDDSTPS